MEDKNFFYKICKMICLSVLTCIVTLLAHGNENIAIVKTDDGAALRELPGIDEKVLVLIPKDTELIIIRTFANYKWVKDKEFGYIFSDWTQVEYNGITGWVFSGYLQKDEDLIVPEDIIIADSAKYSDGHFYRRSFSSNVRSWAWKPWGGQAEVIRDNIFYLRSDSKSIALYPYYLFDYRTIRVFPEAYLVFKFGSELEDAVKIKIVLINEKNKDKTIEMLCIGDREFRTKLPAECKEIKFLLISFDFSQELLGIERIYIEQ